MFGASLVRITGRLLILALLSRLISVEGFGLFSLASVFMDFAGRFRELGVAPALIRQTTLERSQVRAAFGACIASGLALACIQFAIAPALAGWFAAPRLGWMLRGLAITWVLNGAGITAGALLQRQLRFNQIARASTVAYFTAYGLVGTTLALLGFGVSTLVWACIAESALLSALLYASSPHTLRPSFAWTAHKDLFGFGGRETLVRLATYFAHYGDYLMVARLLGVGALGMYSRAYNIMVTPVGEITVLMDSVFFPAFAMVRADTARMRRAFLAATTAIMLVLAPAFAVLCVAAPEVLRGIFGEQWLPATGALQVFALAGVFRAYGLFDALARACGNLNESLARHSMYGFMVVAGSMVGCRFGIVGAAAAVGISLATAYLLMAQLCLRICRATWREFGVAAVPGVSAGACAGVAAGACVAIGRAIGAPAIVTATAAAVGGGLAATLVVRRLPRWCLNEGFVEAGQRISKKNRLAGALWSYAAGARADAAQAS
jgi:PST family polysaccharide transporter